MGKQTRSKKSDPFGKGKVTPIQVAFIVDRYLSDNNFTETRSLFRHEAASFISKSPVQEAPKSLLSLGAMLNEYICLKEEKVMMEQERAGLEQEKFRVQTLLQGMQHVMNSYNASASIPMPLMPSASTKSGVVVPQSGGPFSGSPSDFPVYNTPPVMLVSVPSNTRMECENFTSPVTRSLPLTRKRKSTEALFEAPPAAKKTRSKIPSRMSTSKVGSKAIAQPSPAIQSSPHNSEAEGSLVQVSSVAKCLFNQPMLSPPSNSSGPTTPPQPISSQSEKAISPMGISSVANCSNNNTPQEITPTNCTLISTERVRVTPVKHVAYYSMERRHCISSSSPAKSPLKRLSKRDHVKGRLDFDGSDAAVSLDKPIVEEISTSESEKEADIFDMDLPDLDAFGPNFSFSELLVDLDIDCEGIGCPSQLPLGVMDTVSGSSHESGDHMLGANQVMAEFSSSVKEVFSEKDMHMQGPDTVTEVKSITKCIRILSPAKSCRRSLDQENCSARN